jgi:hypothetical protein
LSEKKPGALLLILPSPGETDSAKTIADASAFLSNSLSSTSIAFPLWFAHDSTTLARFYARLQATSQASASSLDFLFGDHFYLAAAVPEATVVKEFEARNIQVLMVLFLLCLYFIFFVCTCLILGPCCS